MASSMVSALMKSSAPALVSLLPSVASARKDGVAAYRPIAMIGPSFRISRAIQANPTRTIAAEAISVPRISLK